MNKLVFATVIALPLAASFPALAQQGGAAPQPAQPGASQGVAAITLNEDQVRQLQQALNDNGFDAGEVDGVFGARTRAALSRFQSKAGLQPTGQMDQQTLALVGLSGQAQQPAAAPAAPDQSTGRSNPAILNPTEEHVFIGIGFAVPIESAAAAVGISPF